MSKILRFFIRISAFVRKETVEVLRQPRLIFTLVLGPFLILLLFGLGYRTTPREMVTLLVVPEDSKISPIVDEYAERIAGQLDLIGRLSSIEEARQELLTGSVDIVVSTPADPYNNLINNRQSLFTVYHQEIDPFERTYMDVIQRTYINEFNNQALVEVIKQSKGEIETFRQYAQQGESTAATLREALDSGDTATATSEQEQLSEDLSLLRLAAGSGVFALSLMQSSDIINADEEFTVGLVEQLETFQNDIDGLDTSITAGQPSAAEVQTITDVETYLADLDSQLEQFQDIDAQVLTEPFIGRTEAVTPVEIADTDFFVPAVIALLIQHIAISFAALSIISEKRDGTIELFRASPVSFFETLIGKYISYTLLIGLISAGLTALVFWLLQVPMLGSWLNYSLILLVVILSSLGIGFCISLISRSESQAVQYSMIFLLASIFFSGFFIALHRLAPFVHIVSWSLPATYGTALLQDNMLRGRPLNSMILLGLAGIAFLFFIFSSIGLRRQMKAK